MKKIKKQQVKPEYHCKMCNYKWQTEAPYMAICPNCNGVSNIIWTNYKKFVKKT